MTAAITAAAVGAAGAIAGGVISSKGASKAAGSQAQAGKDSIAAQQILAVDQYKKQIEATAKANGLSIDAYLRATPQLVAGYRQAQSILREAYGAPARAAVAASGTPPAEVARLKKLSETATKGLAQATKDVDSIKSQLDSFQYTAASLPMLTQLQKNYNTAVKKQSALQNQLDTAQKGLESATPYTPAQAAQGATTGRAPQAIMTGAQQGISATKTGLTKSIANIQQGTTQARGDISSGLARSIADINQGATQASATQQPFYNAGITGLNNLTRMITPGNTFLPSDPGYQFRFSEGERGVEQSAAARGSQLSGATLKALNKYGQGQASQEYQNTFARNQSVAGMGQQAGTNLSNIATGRGQNLSSLNTGASQYFAGLAQNQGQNLSNLNTGAATNLASIYGNQGNNLANLYTRYGDLSSGQATDLGKALYQGTMGMGDTLANRELNNSIAYQNIFGNLGRDTASNIQYIGNANAAGAIGNAQAYNQALGGVTNSITQGLMLYGNNNNQNQRNNQSYGVLNTNFGGMYD